MAACALAGGYFLLGVTFLLQCVSLASQFWLIGNISGSDISIGLWRSCLDLICVSNFDEGSKINQALGAWMSAVQICILVGFVFCTVGVLIAIFYIFSTKDGCIAWLAFHLFFGSLMYGVASFTFIVEVFNRNLIYHGGDSLMLGFSFYTACAGILTGLFAAALFVVDYISRRSMRIHYVQLN